MKKFRRTKENFTCAHCGHFVEGNGYTNHCPQCLWSKHVDINPGDRRNSCGGLMEPISVDCTREPGILMHQCQQCGAIKRNKLSINDNQSVILSLIREVF